MSLSRKNILVLAAVLSVGLNLFFVGTLGARYMDRPERPPEPMNMRWLVRVLEPETRERLRPELSTYSESLRPVRGEMFGAQRHVNELLATDPINPQELEQAFARLRDANLRYQQLTHQQLAYVFSQLSREQRERAVHFMSERRSPEGDRERTENNRENNPN